MRRSPLLLRKILLRSIPLTAITCFVDGLFTFVVAKRIDGSPSAERSDESPSAITKDLIFFAFYPLVILLHHFLRLWPQWAWLTVFELMLTLTEQAAFTYFVYTGFTVTEFRRAETASKDGEYGNFPGGLFFLHDATIILLGVLSTLFLFCIIWDCLSSKGKGFFKKYHCLSDGPRNGWSVMFGASVLKRRFSTDTRGVIWIRGLIALSLCIGMIVSSAWIFLIRQIQQAQNEIERKVFYTQNIAALPDLSSVAIGITMRNSTLTSIGRTPESLSLLEEFLSIKMIQIGSSEVRDLKCSPHGSALHHLPIDNRAQLGHESATILKEFKEPLEVVTLGVTCDWRPCEDCPVGDGDAYLISFNFDGFDDGTGLALDEVVGVSFAAVTPDARFPHDWPDLLATAPIALSPGSRLIGEASVHARDRLKNIGLAAFGMEFYDRIPVTSLRVIPTDSDTMIPLSNNHFGALRINRFSTFMINTYYERDSLEMSILGGISAVGGIWTFLNGVFAAIFGSTLFLILADRKPLSVYGLVHTMRKEKVSFVADTKNLSAKDTHHMMAILRNHLLDLEVKEEEVEDTHLPIKVPPSGYERPTGLPNPWDRPPVALMRPNMTPQHYYHPLPGAPRW